MTDRPLGDSELDAAIDRAVRDLMGAEPRADLRERVLSELAGTSTRARLGPRFAFGLVAATAAIVVAVQFAERPSERPAEQTVAALPAPADRPRRDSAPPTPGVTPQVPPRAPKRASGPPDTGRGDSFVDDRTIQAASVEAASSFGIAPMTPLARLSPIEPIALSRLEASVIPAPAIDIKPLAVELMEIAPLTPPR